MKDTNIIILDLREKNHKNIAKAIILHNLQKISQKREFYTIRKKYRKSDNFTQSEKNLTKARILHNLQKISKKR